MPKLIKRNKNLRSSRNALRTSRHYSDTPRDVVPRTGWNTASCPYPVLSTEFHCRSTTVATAVLTATPSAITALSFNFTLSDVDNSTAYTGLFDQYRINAVTTRIIPLQNSITLETNSVITTVPLYCVVDYDDSATLTTVAQARGFDTCVVVPPGEECVRTFRPRMAVGAYSGAFTSFANAPAMWCDAASPAIQHYGCKLIVPAVTAAQTVLQSWSIERTYYLSFRKIHG